MFGSVLRSSSISSEMLPTLVGFLDVIAGGTRLKEEDEVAWIKNIASTVEDPEAPL